MSTTPSYFTPDEYIPLHNSMMRFMRLRLKDTIAALILLMQYNTTSSDTQGIPEILEMICQQLEQLHEDISPEVLVAPITRQRVEVRRKETPHAGQ